MGILTPRAEQSKAKEPKEEESVLDPPEHEQNEAAVNSLRESLLTLKHSGT